MTGFQVSAKELPNNIVSISLVGFLGSVASPQLEEIVQKFINRGIYKFVVDLSELKYISTRGVVVLLKFIELVRMNQGDMVLFQPRADVKEVFDVLFGLSELIKLVPDQATAVNFLGQGQSDR